MFHVKHSATLHVSRETLEALERFVSLLLRWNQKINLISARDEPHIWSRHIDDSLQLLPLVDRSVAHAIDLGSGAGFPGLILAIATGVPFHLIEADRRKAAFLREAIRQTGAPAQTHAVRIEDAEIAPATLVTARGLAPLPQLLELTAPLLAPGGTCLFLKGARVEAELTQAVARWHMRVECIPSRTAPDSTILRIDELHRAS